jgi:hypothetical protein
VEAVADGAAFATMRFSEGIDSDLEVIDAELELTRVRPSELLNLVQLHNALGAGGNLTSPG